MIDAAEKQRSMTCGKVIGRGTRPRPPPCRGLVGLLVAAAELPKEQIRLYVELLQPRVEMRALGIFGPGALHL